MCQNTLSAALEQLHIAPILLFRLHKERVFYVSEKIMKQAANVARENLISLGMYQGESRRDTSSCGFGSWSVSISTKSKKKTILFTRTFAIDCLIYWKLWHLCHWRERREKTYTDIAVNSKYEFFNSADPFLALSFDSCIDRLYRTGWNQLYHFIGIKKIFFAVPCFFTGTAKVPCYATGT